MCRKYSLQKTIKTNSSFSILGDNKYMGCDNRHLGRLIKFRVRLHQASASIPRQLSDDTSNTVLIENSGVAPKWGLQPIFKELHCFQ